ncbi:MAG: flippase [Pseudomonadales bacterium]|nr:flippase [Pseudomonadales bacterium]
MNNAELLLKGGWTLLCRGVGAGLAFCSVLLFSRVLGAAEFGLFSLGLTIITVTSILVRVGLDNVVLKQVAAHSSDDPTVSDGYIYSSLVVICTGGIFFAALLWLFSGLIAENIFQKPELSPILRLFGIVTIPFSVVFILCEAQKGLGRSVFAAFFQVVLPPAVTLVFFGLLYSFKQINISDVVVAVLFGHIVSATIFFYSVRSNICSSLKHKVRLVKLIKEGLPMFSLSIGTLVMSWSDTLILGIFRAASEVGVYYAASRTVLVSTLILVAVNAVTGPIYARLYKKNKLEPIAALARKSSKLMMAIAILPTSVILFYPEWIMSWFGDDYTSGVMVLVVLAVGQFVNIACGSVGSLLVMTGNEKTMRNIIAVTALINIILNVVFAKIFGPIGVAYSTAFAVVMWNVWATLAVKNKLGFWIL